MALQSVPAVASSPRGKSGSGRWTEAFEAAHRPHYRQPGRPGPDPAAGHQLVGGVLHACDQRRACDELLEGFDLHIEPERGAGTVPLYLADTDATIDEFDSMVRQVYDRRKAKIARATE
jgi:hypothetical protein